MNIANKNFTNAIIVILIILVIGLSFILIQNQKTINGQKTTIAAQQKEIDDLNAQVVELSAITPEKLVENAKSILKDQGATFLNNFLERVQE